MAKSSVYHLSHSSGLYKNWFHSWPGHSIGLTTWPHPIPGVAVRRRKALWEGRGHFACCCCAHLFNMAFFFEPPLTCLLFVSSQTGSGQAGSKRWRRAGGLEGRLEEQTVMGSSPTTTTTMHFWCSPWTVGWWFGETYLPFLLPQIMPCHHLPSLLPG